MSKVYIENLVENNHVVIFSKRYCPYCVKAKKLIHSLGVKFVAVELDKVSRGVAIQSELTRMTVSRTVPSIWINGNFIGGCDSIYNLHARGQLVTLLR